MYAVALLATLMLSLCACSTVATQKQEARETLRDIGLLIEQGRLDQVDRFALRLTDLLEPSEQDSLDVVEAAAFDEAITGSIEQAISSVVSGRSVKLANVVLGRYAESDSIENISGNAETVRSSEIRLVHGEELIVVRVGLMIKTGSGWKIAWM